MAQETIGRGERRNENKPRWSLVDFKSIEPLVKVLEFGAVKYAPDNWKKGFDKQELTESLLRHAMELANGQENDSESGLPLVGHIMCNAMFYQYHSDHNSFKNKSNEEKFPKPLQHHSV